MLYEEENGEYMEYIYVLGKHEAGQAVWSTEYTPFGGITITEGELRKAAKFTGKDLDEDTGLYYFNARWYDQEIGRFISEDPLPKKLLLQGSKVVKGKEITYQDYIERNGLNLYTYCKSNPLKYMDPDGLDAIPIVFNEYIIETPIGSVPMVKVFYP